MMEPPMHLPLLALSCWPEWAWAICYLGKSIENRGRRQAPAWLVGRWFCIHGTQSVGGRPMVNGKATWQVHGAAVQEMLSIARLAGAAERIPSKVTMRQILDRGRGIVAVARMAEIRPPIAQRIGWHMPNCWGYYLPDVHVLKEPVPCGGALGFWRVPSELHGQIAQQLPAGCPRTVLRQVLP
jgi:hypothetical protein